MLVTWVLIGISLPLSILVWLTVGPIGLATLLGITLIVDRIADQVTGHRFPLGRISAVNVGLAGGWLGGWFLDQSYGPSLRELSLIPAVLGVVNARVLAEVVFERISRRRTERAQIDVSP